MNERLRFLIKKAIRYAIIFFAIVTINFIIPRLMPGDPIRNLLGEDFPTLSDEVKHQLLESYGLTEPLHIQYLKYLKSVFSMDLGYSIHCFRPVTEMIAQNIPVTLTVVLPALIISVIIAMIVGTWAGLHPGSKIDKGTTSFLLLIYCFPAFFLSLLFISIFSAELRLFPLGQLHSFGRTDFPDLLWHITLPLTVLVLSGLSSKFLIMRNSVAQVSHEKFIETAKSRGYDDNRITFRHVLRNAFPPYIAAIAPSFGFIFEGAMVMEIVFSINGIGMLMFSAVLSRDYPLIQGCFLVTTIAVLVANFIGDLAYGAADPRIRDQEGG